VLCTEEQAKQIQSHNAYQLIARCAGCCDAKPISSRANKTQ